MFFSIVILRMSKTSSRDFDRLKNEFVLVLDHLKSAQKTVFEIVIFEII